MVISSPSTENQVKDPWSTPKMKFNWTEGNGSVKLRCHLWAIYDKTMMRNIRKSCWNIWNRKTADFSNKFVNRIFGHDRFTPLTLLLFTFVHPFFKLSTLSINHVPNHHSSVYYFKKNKPDDAFELCYFLRFAKNELHFASHRQWEIKLYSSCYFS